MNSGEAISATCSILKGDFPMDISWAFNGVSIDSERSDQYTITKSKRLSVLAIDAVAARHAGEYTCTASNKAGASSHTAVLAVNGKKYARICVDRRTSVSDFLSFRRRESWDPPFFLPFSLSLSLFFSLIHLCIHRFIQTRPVYRVVCT